MPEATAQLIVGAMRGETPARQPEPAQTQRPQPRSIMELAWQRHRCRSRASARRSEIKRQLLERRPHLAVFDIDHPDILIKAHLTLQDFLGGGAGRLGLQRNRANRRLPVSAASAGSGASSICGGAGP
jgi:hypothetical protein